MNQEPPKEPEPITSVDSSNSALKEVISTGIIFVTAFLVAVFIIAFVFRSYQVDGPSMEKTLQNGDKLIIWKLPKTWSKITGHPYIPNRGDIIVFSESGLNNFQQTPDTKQLIKRVIGLPGDRVVIANNVVTIYNKQHPNGYQPDKLYFKKGQIPQTNGDIDVVLGKNQLYMYGDNRPDSLDSRAFGPINANQVIGKLILRVFPINHISTY
ncbi:MAG TPA: signal peptidase I [Patescibacteria group bacterium]|nr:signal peptidase I [Patescibacteria group bacterium]